MMMDLDPTALLLARIQFAFTISFHFIFPSLTIGLASYLAVLEALWLRTGKPHFLDLAMVMGTGFPPQRGGPLHYADSLGIADVVASLNRLASRHGQRFAPCDLLTRMALANQRFFPEHAPAASAAAA